MRKGLDRAETPGAQFCVKVYSRQGRSHIVEQLLLQGWQVTATHRAGSQTRVLLHLAKQYPEALTVKTADITNRDSLVATMPINVGAVFHVAAMLSQWIGGRDQNYRTNVLGTRNVVDVALAKNATKLIHTSTVAVFLPNNGSIVTEDSELKGLENWNSYGNTKVASVVTPLNSWHLNRT